MDELISALKSYIVLSLQDLSNIKETISHRYAHLSSTERAEILAMALHTHLDKHLSGVYNINRDDDGDSKDGVEDADTDTVTALKHQILSDTLAKHIYTITRHDIFQSIYQLDLPEEMRVSLAESWLSESVKVMVPRWALEQVIYGESTNRSIPNTRSFDTERPRLKIDFHLWYHHMNRWMGKMTTGIATILILISLVSFVSYFRHRGDEPMLYGKGLYHTDPRWQILFEHLGDLSLSALQTDDFSYQRFDYFSVKSYILLHRNGLIGQSEHYNLIIQMAKFNDVDPLLLFAIIGHEQAFVPLDAAYRDKIIHNPYNVYHSWVDYNTNLVDATQIAINTIKIRLKTKPSNTSSFEWLNLIYAEDPNWHLGVKAMYNHLCVIGRSEKASIHDF